MAMRLPNIQIEIAGQTERSSQMGDIKINRINKNDEILAKLMNSVAAKYDCKVSFEDDTGMVINDCDEEAKPSIIREVAGIFGVKE